MNSVGAEITKAISSGDQEGAIALLRENPEHAGWENENKQSLYWAAALYGRVRVLQELGNPQYQEYADVWAVDRWYQSPIEMARRAGHHAAVKVIQQAQSASIEDTPDFEI